MADLRKIVEILIRSKNQAGPGLKEAEKELKGVQSAASGLTNILGVLTAGLSVAALGAFVKGQLDAADAVRDFSIRMGESVEETSRLKYVADQSGTSIESLAVGVKVLVRNAKELPQKFKDLGLSATDAQGRLKTTRQLLEDVAGVMQGLSETDQIALSVDLLGRSGPELIEFLRMGPDQIRKIAEEADKVGAVVTQEEADRADEFNDTLKKMQASVGSLGRDIGTALAPAVISLTGGLAEAIQGIRAWISTHSAWVSAIGAILAGLAVSGGLIGTVLLLTKVMAAATVAASAFWSSLLGPVGLVAGAVAGLILLTNAATRAAEAAGKLPGQGSGGAVADATGRPGASSTAGGFNALNSALDAANQSAQAEAHDRLEALGSTMGTGATKARDYAAELKKVNEEIDRLTLPGKLAKAQRELQELTFKPNSMESQLRILGGPTPHFGPGGKGSVGFTPAPLDFQDPLAGQRSPGETPDDQKRREALDDYIQSLQTMGEVGKMAADQVGQGIGQMTYGFITGEGEAMSFGKMLTRVFAQVVASIVAAVAQLVVFNSLLALFGGGTFSPFKGIKKIFGGRDGAMMKLASGALMVGGPGGVDQAGPLMMNRGELLTPAPITRQLAKFLDGVMPSGGMAGLPVAGGGGVTVNMHVGMFMGSRAEANEAGRRIGKMVREAETGRKD